MVRASRTWRENSDAGGACHALSLEGLLVLRNDGPLEPVPCDRWWLQPGDPWRRRSGRVSPAALRRDAAGLVSIMQDLSGTMAPTSSFDRLRSICADVGFALASLREVIARNQRFCGDHGFLELIKDLDEVMKARDFLEAATP
jgi:hypothetical protein